jgi:SAM-dependent methyltransferase
LLALEGSDSPLSARELRLLLETRPKVWAWVDAPRTPWVRRDDAVGIVAARTGGLPVVEEAGHAMVAAPDDPRPAIGVVQELFRHGRGWPLDRAPWSAALALGTLRGWSLVEAACRLGGPVAHLADQVRPAPTVAEAEATQAQFYSTPEVVAGYTHSASEGLSNAEQQIASRWMRPGDRVLDVGCGAGREALGFARCGMRVLALDGSAAATKEARRLARDLPADAGDVSFETVSFMELTVPADSFDVVFLASDVYASIPGRANRVAALARARAAVRPGGIVVVPADVGGRRIGRILIDAPRRVLRAFGAGGFEAGDRWIRRGPPPTLLFRHGFANEAEVIAELDAAGLVYRGRISSYVAATRSEARSSATASPSSSLVTELARVIAALPRIERARRSLGPGPLVALVRRHAVGAERRDPASRARLRQVIAICDRLVPFGGGCYRRSLLEIALDAGAAEEPLLLGLRGEEGHAWLQSSAPAERFDVTFDV